MMYLSLKGEIKGPQVGQQYRTHPPVQETQETPLLPLGWENLLEKKMAAHPSIPAWKTPWPEEPGGLQSRGSQRVRHN